MGLLRVSSAPDVCFGHDKSVEKPYIYETDMKFLQRNIVRLMSLVIVLLFSSGFFVVLPHSVLAQTTAEQLKEEADHLESEIEELKRKLSEIQTEKNTLSATVRYLDTTISINEKEIEKTRHEIAVLEIQITDLGQRIVGLQASLGELSEALIDRVQAQYKKRATDSVSIIFATTGLSNFFKEHKYYQQVRTHTQELLVTTELKRQVYDEEKHTKEDKQNQMQILEAQLEAHQVDLAQQQLEKQKLLEETKNNEANYQKLLAQALAEKKALDQALVDAVQVGPVKRGDVIALVGNSGYPDCSTGPHLHFEIQKNGAWVDPAPYLSTKEVKDEQTNSNWTVGSGSWGWPVADTVRMTQRYGQTPWSRRYAYSGGIHTGFDMVSTSGNLIRAPADGILYESSQKCFSSIINIKYIDHGDGIKSFYLHVQ